MSRRQGLTNTTRRIVDPLGVFGRGGGGDEGEELAREQFERAQELYGGLELPTVDQLTGQLHLAGPSQVGQAQADPYSIEAQRAALQQLQQMGRGGLTAQEDAAWQQGQRSARAYDRSQRAALEQMAQARGLGGSGMSLAAQLQAQQGGADRAAMAQTELQANAHMRALQALQGQAALAGQMRGQSFGEQVTRGSAIDRFNQGNVDRRNTYEARRGAAQQQGFTNRYNQATGQAGAASTLGNFEWGVHQNDQAQRRADDERLAGYAQTAGSVWGMGGGGGG